MSSLRSLLLIRWSFCLFVSVTSTTAGATCFYPSGLTAEVDLTFSPCNTNSSAVSMCCNYDNGDKCTPQGLCLSGSNAFYRDMCTDQTWKAPECVKMCMGKYLILHLLICAELVDIDIWNPQVTPCDDGSWCCGPPDNSTTKSCCSKGQGVKLLATTTGTLPVPVSLATSIGSSSTLSSSISVSSAAPTILTSAPATSSPAVPVSKSKSKDDDGTAIGAGVGVSVGVVLIALVTGFWFWRRKHNKKVAEMADVERFDTARGATGSERYAKDAYITSTESSPLTRYGTSAIEEGGVMTALATGNKSVTSHRTGSSHHAVHPLDGEIHEIDPGDRIHELPVVEPDRDQKNVYHSPDSEKL